MLTVIFVLPFSVLTIAAIWGENNLWKISVSPFLSLNLPLPLSQKKKQNKTKTKQKSFFNPIKYNKIRHKGIQFDNMYQSLLII